jgi:hypothetical protein
MKTRYCDTTPLFEESVQQPFDELIQKLFAEVESSAGAVLKTYAGVFGAPPKERSDFDRVLGQAVRGSMPKLVDKRLLGSIAKSLAGDLACTSRELRRNLARAGARPPEHDFLYLLLYGFKHGLSDLDIASVPVREVAFTFRLDPTFTRIELAEVGLEYTSRASERSFLSTSSEAGGIQRAGTVAKKTGSDEAKNWVLLILTLPWKEIFECLKSLVELIREALTSGEEDKIEEAIEKIDDAIEDINDEIEDIDEDIDDLKEDIEEEEDRDDKKELQEELDELEDKKDKIEDAKRNLEKAKEQLNEAKKTGSH